MNPTLTPYRNRMTFTVTGDKAKPVEPEVTIHDLLTRSKRSLAQINRRRIVHASTWENKTRPGEKRYSRAILTLPGIFVN